MDKPILTYDVRQQENRASGGVMYVPRIVDRNDSLPLEEVIVRAIRQGRIVGIKESAASAIADAIARQMYEEFREGNGVRFGNYFYARVYLKGTTDGNGTLSADRIRAGRIANGNKWHFCQWQCHGSRKFLYPIPFFPAGMLRPA